MDKSFSYRCPYSGLPLTLQDAVAGSDGGIRSGRLHSPAGHDFEIVDGMPRLFDSKVENLNAEERQELDFYQASADAYDATMDWVFRSFHEDEDAVREGMIDPLALKPGDRVLETGCGTCRDSLRIARRIGADGVFYMQDLSSNMLTIGRDSMQRARAAGAFSCRTEYFVGNALRLPFPDNYFDAAFHFGGFNIFADKRAALAEMARVTRVGGHVVVGDESLAPWLRDTEYGRILMNSSPLYRHAVPLETVPVCARKPSVHWLLGNAYYVISFEVGEGEPPLDLDLPIVGRRGGTHRTRYYGMLEGVTVETKQKAMEAAKRRGLSLHDWLDSVVRRQADEDLG